MAISGVTEQTGTYETSQVYSSSPSKTSGLNETAKQYLTELQQKYSNVNITVADFSGDRQLKSYMFGCSGYNNIAISSSILKKMASDPATAAKYEKVIADVPDLGEEFKKEVAAMGGELLACGTVIDKNGKVSYWGIGKAETVENPGTVYKEKVQKQLEEKRAKKKEEEALKEKKQEEAEKQNRLQEKRLLMAESREELLEKMKTVTGKEASTDARIKEEGKGIQLDLTI